MKSPDIAIIGMSCIFPGAEDTGTFWSNIINKTDAIGTVPRDRIDDIHFDKGTQGVDRFYCSRGGFIPAFEFDPLRFGILPLAVEGTEPDHLITLDLAYKALEDAGVWDKGMSLEKTAIIIGKGNYAGPGATRAIEIIRTAEQITQVLRNVLPHLEENELEKVKREFQQQKGRFGADTAMGLIPNLAASLVANRLNLGGAAYTLDAACASSLLAIDHAAKELSSSRCNMVLAGGVHVGQNAPFWSIFTQLGALSKKQQIRPFDKQADGLLIGEGCGFVVLKKLEDAISDNHKIYAVIKGIGISSDGSGASVMSPSVKGQARAVELAWEQAGLDLKDVGYIEAHGTGTPLGDKTEIETLTQVFGKDKKLPKAGIGTVKSNIGHAMPAAGIAGLIKTALALYYGKLPPTLHCDDPLEQLADSRFEPVREVRDWDTSGLPKIAGVNAFGFGGINAHVVLAGFEERKTAVKENSIKKGDVLLLARKSKEELLDALMHKETIIGEGHYRVALFDPTPERINKAAKIISKGLTWKNRQDIWFTDHPLLLNGGKIAFVFPGLDGLAGGEIESVARYFNLPLPHSGKKDDGLLNQALKILDKSSVLDTALKQLGVSPDMNAGHSVGEWLAARSAGLAEESSVAHLLGYLNPETFELSDSRFIAVGCGIEKLEPIMAGIPDLYLSNDNCPNQVILCGTYTALEKLIVVLKAKQLFHQVLPFQSGFHSPFVEDKLDLLLGGMDAMRFQKPRIPLWSATTLDVYPESPEAIKQLSVQHLIKPVRFRELTEKLYKEGARVFIQVGSGGLIGFIEDTLKGKTFSAVASNVPVRSGLAQLQRVLAALFCEGHEIDTGFLGIDEKPRAKGIKLQLGLPILQDFPLLKQLAARSNAPVIKNSLERVETAHPILKAIQSNMDEMMSIQAEMIELFQKRAAPPALNPDPRPPFSKQLHISLENCPYLIDHSLLRQPKDWHCAADMDPVIPMTMLFELFAEAAEEQAPAEKIFKILNTRVFQWMNVSEPFRETIQGVWKEPRLAYLDLAKYAAAEVLLASALPAAPAIPLDIGRPLAISVTPEEIYAERMFHGPKYQGIKNVKAIGEKGIIGMIQSVEGKGSLLDNAGQLFGLWLQLILPKDRIAFPVKIQEVAFYDDMHDQEGEFECTCMLTALDDEFASATIVLKRSEKTWAIITGWQNRRLEIDEPLWRVSMSPLHNGLSEEIAPGIFMFRNAYTRVVSWDFILKRYFNQEEKEYYQSLSPGKRKEWMISRVAVKDAVRALLHKTKKDTCYPIEFSIKSDPAQRPFVQGGITEGIHISLAHKGTEAVAIAGHEPLGIDIESIRERSSGFLDMSFTKSEQLLWAGKDEAEWSTRFWVAKEAYGKMLGTGLKGNPKAYVVEAVNNEDLVISNRLIKTINYKKHIIGWTQ